MFERNQVTPSVSFITETTYLYDGDKTITCFRAHKKNRDSTDVEVVTGEALFSITLEKDAARILMDDLYYGEYTGG